MRPNGRATNEMRAVKFTRNYPKHVEANAFSRDEMLALAEKGIAETIVEQNNVLKDA